MIASRCRGLVTCLKPPARACVVLDLDTAWGCQTPKWANNTLKSVLKMRVTAFQGQSIGWSVLSTGRATNLAVARI